MNTSWIMMMQPSTTMIKILIFCNCLVFDEPHFLKKLWRKLQVFLLINVWWFDIYCTLTICLTCNRCIRERQRKVNTQREDRLSWAFRVFIYVQQYQVSYKKQSIFRTKKVASSFLVQLHWSIQNSSCTLKVPMFSKSSSDINRWLSNYQGFIQSGFSWWCLFERISAR